jgi:hypothetical protein
LWDEPLNDLKVKRYPQQQLRTDAADWLASSPPTNNCGLISVVGVRRRVTSFSGRHVARRRAVRDSRIETALVISSTDAIRQRYLESIQWPPERRHRFN